MIPESHVGMATLQRMTRKKLREFEQVLIVHDGVNPAAVLVPYWMFQKISCAFMILREVGGIGEKPDAK